MSAANESTLGQLHQLVAEMLAQRIASGEATASDMAVAVKFLKDNNITCVVDKDNALGELERKLAERAQRRTKMTAAELDAALDATKFLN